MLPRPVTSVFVGLAVTAVVVLATSSMALADDIPTGVAAEPAGKAATQDQSYIALSADDGQSTEAGESPELFFGAAAFLGGGVVLDLLTPTPIPAEIVQKAGWVVGAGVVAVLGYQAYSHHKRFTGTTLARNRTLETTGLVRPTPVDLLPVPKGGPGSPGKGPRVPPRPPVGPLMKKAGDLAARAVGGLVGLSGGGVAGLYALAKRETSVQSEPGRQVPGQVAAGLVPLASNGDDDPDEVGAERRKLYQQYYDQVRELQEHKSGLSLEHFDVLMSCLEALNTCATFAGSKFWMENPELLGQSSSSQNVQAAWHRFFTQECSSLVRKCSDRLHPLKVQLQDANYRLGPLVNPDTGDLLPGLERDDFERALDPAASNPSPPQLEESAALLAARFDQLLREDPPASGPSAQSAKAQPLANAPTGKSADRHQVPAPATPAEDPDLQAAYLAYCEELNRICGEQRAANRLTLKLHDWVHFWRVDSDFSGKHLENPYDDKRLSMVLTLSKLSGVELTLAEAIEQILRSEQAYQKLNSFNRQILLPFKPENCEVKLAKCKSGQPEPRFYNPITKKYEPQASNGPPPDKSGPGSGGNPGAGSGGVPPSTPPSPGAHGAPTNKVAADRPSASSIWPPSRNKVGAALKEVAR